MIREYDSRDWEAIRDIYDRAKPDEMHGSVPAKAIIPMASDPAILALFEQSKILLCELDGCVAGFGGYQNHTITFLFVHPDHRRKGVAIRLIKAMLNELGDEAKLNVAKMNTGAFRLYEQLGFVIESEFQGK